MNHLEAARAGAPLFVFAEVEERGDLTQRTLR